jgi:hypothetical protein
MKILLTITLLGTNLLAAPALAVWKSYSQEDGSEVTLKLQGDEYFNSYKTEEGDIVKYNRKNKNFVKFDISNDKVVYSSVPYRRNNKKDIQIDNKKLQIKIRNMQLQKKEKFKSIENYYFRKGKN